MASSTASGPGRPLTLRVGVVEDDADSRETRSSR